MTRYLVRTMNACPAPGIAPFRTVDWLMIGAVVVLPWVLIVSLGVVAGH